MINLTTQKLKSVLLFKRTLVLFCVVMCSLIANANGTQWYPQYIANVGVADGSTGSGKVYINAKGYTNATKRNEDDPGYDTEANPTETSTEISAANFAIQQLILQTRLTIEGTKNNKEWYEVWKPDYIAPWAYIYYKYENVTLRAVANPGSRFEGWTVSSTSTDATITIDTEETYARPPEADDGHKEPNSSILTYKPKFIARTYYYQIPGAEATNGGKVYRSDGAINDITAITDWQDKILIGNDKPVPSKVADENGKYPYATTPAKYFYAKPNDEYEFAGWYDGNTGKQLSMDVAYTYSLVAKSEDEDKPTTVTLIAHFIPKAVSEITPDNKVETGIYSGTVGNNNTYPYKKQWQVDLSSTFDPSGNALFDRLYIFGMTTPASGTSITSGSPHGNTNAVTPCYMYVRDGNGYSFSYYVSNVNTSEKSEIFNIDATDVKKIYATGWCPSGSNGYGPNTNGLFYIKGAAGEEVHLYVEDCYLHLRPHTKTGTFDDMHADLYRETFVPGDAPDTRPSVPGVASAVVFECTSTSENLDNPFKPFVHIKGDNLFYGHRGTHFNLDLGALGSYVGVNPILGQYCAALSVKIGNNGEGAGFLEGTYTSNSYTTLTLDDKWPTSATDATQYEHTNGYLKFEKEWYASPSIDLGNRNTVLNFDGGRFELSPNLPTQAQYINNLTICYRTGFVNILGGKYVMSGTGGESTEGTVNINDGSVYVTPFNAMHQDIQGFWCLPGYFEDAVIDGNGKYAESRILRCPANTYVTGGSHPGDIRACDDQNASGHAPKDKISGHLLKKVTLKNNAEVLSNGLVNSSEFMSNTFPSDETIVCDLPNDICTVRTQHGKRFSDYYSTTPYGANSIAPDADDKVHLWLPGHGKHSITYVPWEVFFPKTTLGIADYEQTLGISNTATQEFYNDGSTVKKKLQHMLFVDIDDNILKYLTENTGSTKLPVQVPGSTGYQYVTPTEASEPVNHKSLDNPSEYTVYNSVIYVTHAIADKWMLFCPPFDVTNVYIIETANETLLSDQGNSIAENARDNTLNIQSKYNLDAMSIVGANMVSNEKAITFWEHYSGYEKYVANVRSQMNSNSADENMQNASTYYADADGKWTGPLSNITNRTKLIHLTNKDGKFNYNDAHYYLYKQDTDNFTEWGEDSEGNDLLKTNWKLADATILGENGTTCVMKKGEVYAIQLPYCPGCNDGTKWDYWTGKMLVFEGIGENTIAGTGMHATIVSDELSNGLHGNYTFANIVDANIADDYFNGIKNLYFNAKDDVENQFAVFPPAQLNPGDAFLKLTPTDNLPGRVKSINAETGAITWEEDDDDNQGTTTGTPTISGERSMIVYTIDGGVGIIPVAAQNVAIYNAAGQIVTSQYLTEEVQIPLPAGIYLICGENEMAKAVVR